MGRLFVCPFPCISPDFFLHTIAINALKRKGMHIMEADWTPQPQGVITNNYQSNLAMIKKAAHADQSEDVQIHEFQLLGHPAALIYLDGMVNNTQVQRFLLLPALKAPALPKNETLSNHLMQTVLPVGSVTETSQLTTLLTRIFSGDAALICDTMDGALIADMKGFIKRIPGQPVNETVVVGPHEGFNESLRDNVVLIRRMMRTPALISEAMLVGNKIPTRLCLLYLDGIARKETIDEIKRRLQGCNVDYVSSSGMLEQLIEDKPYSLFPQSASTERPDRAVSFLTEGQVVILLENSPQALAFPMGLMHLYHASDDTNMRWQYGTFLRILRMAGMLIALLLPAIFVSLSMFHPEGMSLPLLTSVLETQSKVPLSLFTSMLLVLLIFSLINEAGVRVPGAMGGSLSIVSGLILGQAAVDADLFSPLIIIVVAISGLGSYAVPSFSLTLSLRIAQLFLVLASGVAGYLGLTLGLFFLFMRLAGLTSLHFPYFAPMAPKRPANPDQVVRMPVWRQRLRSAFANPFNMNRTLGQMRAWDQPKEEK